MPDEDVFDHFATLSSNVNSYISNEVTCYEVFSNSKFKENLSYLIKMVFTPHFNKELVSYNLYGNIIVWKITIDF